MAMAAKKISAERIADRVLGQAHLSSARAYIFCDRIAAARLSRSWPKTTTFPAV
jgi:hypothetical protein